METKPARSRRGSVSIKIESPQYERLKQVERKGIHLRIPSILKSAVSFLKIPFSAGRDVRRFKRETRMVDHSTVSREESLAAMMKRLSADNIYWKLIYPLPVNSELEGITSDLEYIKEKLKAYSPAQLRYLKAHAQGIESRYQVSWVVYVIMLFAIALYGHSFISQPYFLAFFFICLVAVMVIVLRYIRARFLVALIKEAIDLTLSEE